MNILLLAIFCCLIGLFALKTSTLRIISPTFISAMMFFAFSIIYLLSFDIIQKDITLKTVGIILVSLFMTYVGELMVSRISFVLVRRKSSILLSDANLAEKKDCNIPSATFTYLVTGGMCLVALIRFINLRYFAFQYGSFDNFISMMSVARVAVNQGEEFNLGGGVIAQAVYIATAICFVYIYLFLEQIIVFKKRRLYLLLPVLADCLIELSTTGRTSIIIIAVGFVVAYFYLLINRYKRKRIHINKKLYFYGFVFLVIFFIYGNARTGNNFTELVESIRGSIVSYSAASIYGLDYYINSPWSDNLNFAVYTGRYIYSSLGIDNVYIPSANLPFFFFGENGYSNIYTSLVLPIQDYGLLTFLISRIVLAIISTIVLKSFLNKSSLKYSYYVYYMLSIFIVYCYINVPIADRFYTYFLNPLLIGKYIVYMIIFAWIIRNIKKIGKAKK